MTLSARLAAGPSRRLALLSALVPAGGLCAAASVIGARWPDAIPALVPLACVASAFVATFVLASYRRTGVLTLTVSARAEIDVFPDPAPPPGSWRLVEATMAWDGFAMLALRKSDPSVRSPVLRIPVFDAELASADRRALARFVAWSLRGGGGAVGAKAPAERP